MTKEQIVKTLKENMPKFTGSEDEIELKTVLYLYVELGKMKQFDERYFFGDQKAKKMIERESKRSTKNIDAIAEKKKITCITLSSLYSYVLSEFRIYSAIKQSTALDVHNSVYVFLRNGKTLDTDIQTDLHNIQTKSELEYFEYELEYNGERKEKMDPKKRTEMLIEIGYIKDEKDYRNKKLEKLNEKIKNMNAKESLKTILNEPEVYEGVETEGIVEALKYYKKILRRYQDRYLDNKIHSLYCYKEDKEKKEDGKYTICIFSDENEEITPYLYSSKQKRFLQTDANQLKKMEEEGLKIGVKSQKAAVKKLKRYIEQEGNKTEINKQEER